ncbi:RidA family protein [Methylocapsa sp. S129]|uniref:RidA family protein n=1 Tax=Methylocapsa sp. S129 TaxID=1641869 RepID=UPI00131C0783|nr:RidA family protein [Methylocapsa sp. S129]
MIKAVGPKVSFPISPAVVAGNLFFATVVPVDLQTGHFVGGPIEAQTRQALLNLDILLREAGGNLSNVAQVTVYLIDSKDVIGLNKVYSEFFTQEPYPSRATVVVRELIGPPGIRVEVTAQAYLLSS